METPQRVPYAFQPIFDVRNNQLEVYGREALIRPKNTTPGEFINNMIENGRIHELEFMTFFNAVEQFQERGYKEKLFINSFPSEVLTIDEFAVVKELCMDKDSSNFVIESLEYGDGFPEHRFRKKMQNFKRHKYNIALDDFGTGFNSVNALAMMNPDIVKIDRHFVTNCIQNDAGRNTIEIFIHYLKMKGIEVLVEGVETKEQFLFLSGLNVDYMQGFYLGYPE